MATIYKRVCDICGKEGARPAKMLVYRTFDAEDGWLLYETPTFTTESLDLCEDCMLKATNVHSVGVKCRKFKIESPIQKTIK